jgi:hypothetical protein
MQRLGCEAKLRRHSLPPASETVVVPNQTTDPYLSDSVLHVRAHIRRVDERLSKATDALDIERLARARSALSEQERVLSGRPLPGALRPSGKVSRSAAGNVEPV